MRAFRIKMKEPKKKIWCGNEFLKMYSSSSRSSFQENSMASRRVKSLSSYSLSILKPLHSLCLGIVKLMKDCGEHYLSLSRLRTGGARKERKTFVKVQAVVLCDSFSSLSKVMGSFQEHV